MIYRKIFVAFTFTVLFLLQGCEILTVSDPHENFKEILKMRIGNDIAGAQKHYSATHDMQIVPLSNGNLEYRFTIQYKRWNHGPCTTILEADRETQKVIRADFVGERRDCVSFR